MGIKKEDLHSLIDQLHENKQQEAYDYLKELIQNPTTEELKAYWSVIDNYVEPDEEPLSEETQRQMEKPEYTTWDQLKQDCNRP